MSNATSTNELIKENGMYNLKAEEVFTLFDTDSKEGLSSQNAKSRLEKFGRNKIREEKKRSNFLILLDQFQSPIVYLLLFATALSFYFKEWLDGFAIFVVILINGLIGFYMEFRAAKSMDALKRLTRITCKAKRDGFIQELDSEEIVPGDIVYFEAGDIVSADARIFESTRLQTDESALTGESTPCDKNTNLLPSNLPLAERSNMLFKGTFILKGNSFSVVTHTGMDTEIGKIAEMLQSAKPGATPLEKKLSEFSKRLIQITVGLVILIFFVGLWTGQHFLETLETSIALAVAAIPEGLPIVATLALAQGMLKMAKHNVIVKKLSAVETLGGTNVICTDKTGTLTQNKIEVVELVTSEGVYTFDGEWKGFEGRVRDLIAQASILCNTAELDSNSGSENEIGDPLETGLLKFTKLIGFDISKVRDQNPKISEMPFDSDLKMMATIHGNKEGFTMFVKGAAESIIERSSFILSQSNERQLNNTDLNRWLSEADRLASSGMKVIGIAYKQTKDSNAEKTEGLVLLGLLGMIDPPRPEVFSALADCDSAGIKVMMITGDHPSTAKNIASRLGLTKTSEDKIIIGSEMPSIGDLSQEKKADWIQSRIFARVTPKQKLDLVTVLQEKHYIVGMTGDGVNDAPALKKADIGIAMGERGTQVAQDAADMILKDDSFASIVVAIRQGRAIFDNIRKFVIYLLSCNLSELIIVATASILNLHFQLFPLQILFINLITDVLPALALGVTEASPGIMSRLPRPSDEAIIDARRWKTIFVYSFFISASSLGSVFISHFTLHNTEDWNPALCNNILFFTLILAQLFHAFNMGSSDSRFGHSEIIRNRYLWLSTFVCVAMLFIVNSVPVLEQALKLYSLSLEDWLLAIGCAIFGSICIQLTKKAKLVFQ
ncbi:hypothetical protein CH373_09270 [Leptospira perolatii]|uniref:Cation-transporting P-type ATPase N-terminal domain-containing protein n=1 Tax=Leptospira perolatii TaxID=2023191 RepID=A0A2M9ZNQ7_9LEPT|nr:cation-translocating P-type ATPase [Leptospira perolatii]PJZ69677.1 hypothetical protein CH360_10415 [Leptospira perolatii]PJZ73664.1 hypothetical protein CH373_09270 [Leptospira perolatii]